MITETYIRMCREAIELQEQWQPKEADLIIWDYDGNFVQDILRMAKASKSDLNALDVFWLPRQEDLQEIAFNQIAQNQIEGDCEIGHYFIEDFREVFGYEYLFDEFGYWWDGTVKFKTFNEIWLGFVMHYVFDKTWNGESWEQIQ